MTLPRVLGLLGAAALTIAAGWWWLVFRQVIDNGYMSLSGAVLCAGTSSAACDLAMALCGAKHPFGIETYSANLFWLALASLFASLAARTYTQLAD
ncbi:hypothetical protein [Taklimakanibacter albus]|uniref:Uncharacterized protein n=1 Tax=Taklimakanibacter albus TaxID=2800327 RepID=A0ACC5RD58_9HYPH|nr:hypothetical protein [Aestuariivirga sp. YIM B02566]MBK1870579.1 hypothetical protein [Aestuariivirga sp. YIM B02566]